MIFYSSTLLNNNANILKSWVILMGYMYICVHTSIAISSEWNRDIYPEVECKT